MSLQPQLPAEPPLKGEAWGVPREGLRSHSSCKEPLLQQRGSTSAMSCLLFQSTSPDFLPSGLLLVSTLSGQLLCAPQGSDRVNTDQLLKPDPIYTSHFSTWNVALCKNTQQDVFCWRARQAGLCCACFLMDPACPSVKAVLAQSLASPVSDPLSWCPLPPLKGDTLNHLVLVQTFPELRFGVGSSLLHPWRNCRVLWYSHFLDIIFLLRIFFLRSWKADRGFREKKKQILFHLLFLCCVYVECLEIVYLQEYLVRFFVFLV